MIFNLGKKKERKRNFVSLANCIIENIECFPTSAAHMILCTNKRLFSQLIPLTYKKKEGKKSVQYIPTTLMLLNRKHSTTFFTQTKLPLSIN